MNALFDLAGTLAACCTTIAFLPQVIQVWRTKSVKDISLGMYCIFTFGISMWLIYGIGIGSLQITIANAITLILAVSILIMKIRYSRK